LSVYAAPVCRNKIFQSRPGSGLGRFYFSPAPCFAA
jgi:hypothetical protein